MKVKYEELVDLFSTILMKKGFSSEDAKEAGVIFAENTVSGVLSHGINRFPRVLKYIDDGDIKIGVKEEVVFSLPFFERWDCKMGLGPLFAKKGMTRAISLAKESGIGVVALKNNNHWMRGGYFAELASKEGLIGICWSNTTANMPPWGAKTARLGNNPLCIAVPVKDGSSFLLDMAISQYSYGKLETLRLKGENLPYPGGFDKNGKLTDVPSDIEESKRMLPIGYWKGSGLSIALDLIASVISGGNSVKEISDFTNEVALSQIMIVLDPMKLGIDNAEERAKDILSYVKSADVAEGFRGVSYPGESMSRTKDANMRDGVEVVDSIYLSLKELV